MTSPLAGLVVVLAVGLSLAACTTPSSGPGVLDYPDEGAEWCAPASQYPFVALGTPLDVRSGGPITIESVEGVGLSGLEVVTSYVMAVRPTWRLQLTAFPPESEFPDEWPDAIAAEGAVIPEGETWDLVTEVAYDGPGDASLTSIRLTYEQGGAAYVTDAHIALRVTDGPCD